MTVNALTLERSPDVAGAKDGLGIFFLRDGCLPLSPCYHNAITSALAAGFTLQVFAPQMPELDTAWRGRVEPARVQYSLRWLSKHALLPRWRKADFFLGTPRMGVAFAGVLGTIHRRPHAVLCDEIFSGSYAGDDPSHWVRLSNWSHRRARFTILPDRCREAILHQEVSLADRHPIYESPNSPLTNGRVADRLGIRAALSIPQDAFVVQHSGHIHRLQGGHWMLKTLPDLPSNVYLMIQNGLGYDEVQVEAMRLLAQHYRVRCGWDRLTWQEVEHYHAAADCGLVFYFHDGPQFQSMGRSSTKLCMFLKHGIPVIASRQDAFCFLEDYGCGILVDDPESLVAAIKRIRQDHAAYCKNALQCYREFVDPKLNRPQVIEAFSNLRRSR